jgi:hypothetical protein
MTSDQYLDIIDSMRVPQPGGLPPKIPLPLINIPLICTHLELRTDPELAPSFKLPSQKQKGKIFIT